MLLLLRKQLSLIYHVLLLILIEVNSNVIIIASRS